MHQVVPAAVLFYRQHPISEEQVLDALRRQGKDLGKLSPQDLYHWDQDHYGGLAAVEALTRRAGISYETFASASSGRLLHQHDLVAELLQTADVVAAEP